jgi:hypothetical protein
MIVDADTIKACVLAAGYESGNVRQGPADRDPESDPDSGHLTSSFIRPLMLHE